MSVFVYLLYLSIHSTYKKNAEFQPLAQAIWVRNWLCRRSRMNFVVELGESSNLTFQKGCNKKHVNWYQLFLGTCTMYLCTWSTKRLWKCHFLMFVGSVYRQTKRQFLAGWVHCFLGCLAFQLQKRFTPRKTNMEPENHPFGKENDLPNLHFGVPC